jgi:hypothetical protein
MFGDLVDAADAVATRTSAFGGIWRERFRIKQLLPAGIVAGAGVQHAQQVRQRRDAAHRGARGRRTSLLLQRDRGRQTLYLIDFGHRHLVKQPAGVGRNRLQIAALGFGIERSERQGRLAGAGHAGEHDQGVARDVE